MSKLLGRDAILAAKDFQFEDVPVPEWDGTVRVRALSAAEHGRYTASMMLTNNGAIRVGPDGKTPLLTLTGVIDSDIRLLAMAIVDEQGANVFDDKDVAALAEKNGAVVERLVKVAKRLSGIEQPLALVAKNSLSGESAASPIG